MLDLFAYPADVHIHGAGLHFGIELPDPKQEVVAGLYPSLALEKVMEQLEFGQGKVNFLPGDGNAMVLLIEHQFTGKNTGTRFFGLVGDSFEDGAYAKGEFLHIKRFPEVVIGSLFQSFDSMLHSRLGRQHDYGSFL